MFISVKFIPEICLNKNSENIITTSISISQISLSHLSIITYNQAIIARDRTIADIQVSNEYE